MAFQPSWRNFRRMQVSLLAAASLIYAGAVAHAWRVLPWTHEMKLQRMLIWPGVFFVLSLGLILAMAPLRRMLARHMWVSFRTGFGQSAISVLAAVLVLLVMAGFIYWQTWQAANGGRYPAGVFSGYAAGIGLLLAQVFLVKRLENDPTLRDQMGD